jgi:hypothetical protein
MLARRQVLLQRTRTVARHAAHRAPKRVLRHVQLLVLGPQAGQRVLRLVEHVGRQRLHSLWRAHRQGCHLVAAWQLLLLLLLVVVVLLARLHT